MKRIFIFAILALVIMSTTNANDLKINQKLSNRIKNLGINVGKIEIELNPIEIVSYNKYSKNDFFVQKTHEDSWSTIWHNNLDKLDITTTSSSILKEYSTTSLFDKKIGTAWVEGIAGDGIGEWVLISLNHQRTGRPSGLKNFGIIPGYLKNGQTWNENNRVKSVILIIERHGYKKGSEYYDYPMIRLKVKDFKGLQMFDISGYSGSVSFKNRLWLVIEEVYKGTKYHDTSISEIVITGACAPGPEG